MGSNSLGERELESFSSKRSPLSEKDFSRGAAQVFKAFPFWLWLFLIAVIIAILLGTKGWYSAFLHQEKEKASFLEVTNREFSVFLWQFPSFMRMHVSKKNSYLPGFLLTAENLNVETADEFVSAPPDLIFLYHTWHRLLAGEMVPRPIYPKEFEEFLTQLPEWQPKNWKKAPQEYVEFINFKHYTLLENLQTLPASVLPLIVRQAFLGWKNYFMEGPQINEVYPTFAELKAFLDLYPHYARNNWRNIQKIYHQQILPANYLYDLVYGPFHPDKEYPQEQLAPFLKIAFYNAQQLKKSETMTKPSS